MAIRTRGSIGSSLGADSAKKGGPMARASCAAFIAGYERGRFSALPPAGDTALRSRRQTLAERTADLESATRAAMAAPVSDRYRMLLALRERLMSKSLREELAQIHSLQPGASTAAAGPSGSGAGSSADRVPTPTLTTLVQHR